MQLQLRTAEFHPKRKVHPYYEAVSFYFQVGTSKNAEWSSIYCTWEEGKRVLQKLKHKIEIARTEKGVIRINFK